MVKRCSAGLKSRDHNGRFLPHQDPLTPLPLRLRLSTINTLRQQAAASGLTISEHVRQLLEAAANSQPPPQQQ
jgi:hypothetical protein